VSHVLDKPIWSALVTRQAGFAQGGHLARRFPADVSPFVAGLDGSDAARVAMAELIPGRDDISLLEVDPPAAPEGVEETRKLCLQMVWERFEAEDSTADIRPLGDADAADMLELATLTKPGPFRTRTHTMGRFVGVRENGRLIAMAGERLHVPGFHEITAVCTHPDVRGRGLGAALMRVVGARMMQEGDQPFLHSYASNEVAVELYRRLGFTVRAEVIHAVWKQK
jgi:ribosomal protein S18 acetylase RimI-like enzyme